MTKTFDNLIDGAWISAPTRSVNLNPSDLDDVVGEYAQADLNQTEVAVVAARRAFPSWSLASPEARANLLDAVGHELLQRREEIGRLLAREEGKTLPEAIAEVARAGMIFRFFAGEAIRLTGERGASVRPSVEVEITREPIGVVGIITPWNFPIAIPAWKIAPALAYGNTVVFKPADLVPGCGWALAEIIARKGAPSGVFNLVMGRGSVVGETLVNHPDVAGISFTGSATTGRSVAHKAVSRMARVQVEMGGKNPLVVLDDADLDTAVNAAVAGAFFSTGQRCTASSRLIVTEGIHDRFVAALAARVSALRVDDALATGTDLGPVIDSSQRAQDLAYVQIGTKEGARALVQGAELARDKKGYYLGPTLFTEASNSMRICREEIFGPVAAAIRVRDYDEALSIANDTEFGLCAGIATTSLKHASHFKRHAEAGMVMVNLPTAGVDYHVPFGGRKGSSYGAREQGRHAIEFYTAVKTAYTAP